MMDLYGTYGTSMVPMVPLWYLWYLRVRTGDATVHLLLGGAEVDQCAEMKEPRQPPTRVQSLSARERKKGERAAEHGARRGGGLGRALLGGGLGR